MGEIAVFACFDVDRDLDLYERLVAKSKEAGLGFTVSGRSEPFASAEDWSQRTRGRIRRAERILVICGEQTCQSLGVAQELRIAREEEKPYLLLWGRRHFMCTKPVGAKPSEGMYSWTSRTLQEQFALMSRVAQREAAANALKRPERAQAVVDRPGS